MTPLLVAAGGTTAGSGSEHLDHLVHQLWGTEVAAGRLVVLLGPLAPPGWRVLHQWRVLPSLADPHLLVQRGPRQTTVRALTAYRGLRSPRRRAARLALALQTAVRPSSTGTLLTVAVPGGSAPASSGECTEPVTALATALGEVCSGTGLALVGVRRGANAKPTVQLFNPEGRPSGYAKLAWNPLTAGLVQAETQALVELNGHHEQEGVGPRLRVPRLTGQGMLAGRPYLLTEPLPPNIRQLRGATALTTDTLAGLFPVTRQDVPAHVGQVALVLGRLHRLAGLDRSRATTEVVTAARALSNRVRASTTELPVASRWHGDLVPWNAGRDRAGTTWLWDWESGGPDAPAGMDAVHWHLNAAGPMTQRDTGRQLREASERARPALHALGAGPGQRAVVTAVYALSLAERNATLAAAQAGWHRHHLPATAVLDLLGSAQALLDHEAEDGRA